MSFGSSGFAQDVEYSVRGPYGFYYTTDRRITTAAILAGVKGHWFPGRGSFNVYGGVDLGFVSVDNDYNDNETGLAYGVSAGTELPVAEHVRLRLEARHLRMNVREVVYYDYSYSPARRVTLGRPAQNSLTLGFVFGW